MYLIQRGLVAQGFHNVPQEVEMEEEVVEGEDHLQLQEVEIQVIETTEQS